MVEINVHGNLLEINDNEAIPRLVTVAMDLIESVSVSDGTQATFGLNQESVTIGLPGKPVIIYARDATTLYHAIIEAWQAWTGAYVSDEGCGECDYCLAQNTNN